MPSDPSSRLRPQPGRTGIFLFSSLVVLLSFFWQGRKGYNMGDEGYLWYGVQRVLQGEVPIRDFMAYDPGRYYWTAGLLGLAGDDGLLPLRAAVAVFQALGLFVGLWLIARHHLDSNPRTSSTGYLSFLAVSAALLAVWMFPRHKLFDISLSIFLIAIVQALLRMPRPGTCFWAGVGIGLVAVFGRNHGVYGAVACLGAILWQAIGPSTPGGGAAESSRAAKPGHKPALPLMRALALWVAGVVVGFSPVLLMLALVPGFAAAFLDSILFLFEYKGTNLPLPIPWPWLADFQHGGWLEGIRQWLKGAYFIAIPAFGLCALAWMTVRTWHNRPVSPLLAASALLTLPYAHYAWSRADIGHLALGIFPSLIGTVAALSRSPAFVRWPLLLTLCASSLVLMVAEHPGWQCRVGTHCVNLEISGSAVRIDPHTAANVNLLRALDARHNPQGGSFVATPLMPGAYPLLKRRSPVWETYALFPRSDQFQQDEIRRIEQARPGFILLQDTALDGRDDLRFKNTHPMMTSYIETHFERVVVPEFPSPSLQIYRAKAAVTP